MARSRREILEGYLDVMNGQHLDRAEEFLTPDYVEEWPQSGERVVGLENMRAIVRNYPGGFDAGRFDREHARVVGEDEEYVVGPSFSIIHLGGSGDTWTAVSLVRYPDGSRWHAVLLAEFRGDKIARITSYFAPELPAPEWRAGWVEPIRHAEHV
ncbi:MAG TPA: nuclear transport factor 2 family protein [Candidatus Dormibacteraeota bacterium]|nr:nuclear transport factor 2 family protein [Candidatus Dormibacteraeota bacterium]